MGQTLDKWKLGIALAARQWTKTDLAGALGVPRSTLSSWLHGHYPPPSDWVDRIERALGVKPHGLRPRPFRADSAASGERAAAEDAAGGSSAQAERQAAPHLAMHG